MKKLLSLVAAILFAAISFAQVDEATITVIGTGVNEEQATLQGLRSAIEQTFGTFVSANTTILNDRLVRDEIVSVSNGNVKQYKKLAVTTLPNKQVSVTLTATISINKLISYAKSKGSKAEFEGQSYAANVKYMQLRAENAKKLLSNIAHQISMLSKDLYEVSLELGDPSLMYRYQMDAKYWVGKASPDAEAKYCEDVYLFPATICFYSNVVSHNIYKLYTEAINAIQISDSEIDNFKRNGIAICYIYNPKVKKDVVVPISWEDKNFYLEYYMLNEFRDRMLNVQIREIGNFVNLYEFTDSMKYASNNLDKKKTVVRLATSYMDRPKWWWASIERNTVFIRSAYFPYYFIRDWGIEILDNFALDETKIPITLTKEQEKLKKRGLYNGPLYEIKYGDPKLIRKFKVELLIPVDKMNTFKGFEILFKK